VTWRFVASIIKKINFPVFQFSSFPFFGFFGAKPLFWAKLGIRLVPRKGGLGSVECSDVAVCCVYNQKKNQFSSFPIFQFSNFPFFGFFGAKPLFWAKLGTRLVPLFGV